MKRLHIKRLYENNKGETLVEVMVAFIVLLITLALFSNAITFAGNASNNSIDTRRAADSDYSNLHSLLASETSPGSKCAGISDTGLVPSDSIKTSSVSGNDGIISLNAYKYESGSTVYWVYR